ncbi:MAG TPA: ribosome assembly RNA-binding protein YhbY [Roseiflexaceae bacterium]|nr:ribosome assembly RNA-binding protein YhbY [Roseiflexaceae bacterium]
MRRLNQNQRAWLRSKAHHLQPVVQVGKNGLTEQVQYMVEQALDAHELIKIKFMDFRDQKRELSEQMADAAGGELITIIGNIAVVYRENANPDKRKLVLPA